MPLGRIDRPHPVSLIPLKPGEYSLLATLRIGNEGDGDKAEVSLPITVSPDAPVEQAAKLIAQHKHNRLPVVEDGGRLVGVVTRLDVLDAITD